MNRLRLCLAALALTLGAGAVHASKPSGAPGAGAPAIVHLDLKPSRAHVRAKLAERRDLVVKRFLAYRDAQVYPVNRRSGLQHVWLDDLGNLCAAATLVSHDWGRDIAIAAARGNNGLQLADVKTGELADWILTSGLTHREIVAIQVPGSERRWQAEEQRRDLEIARMHNIYVDVERQIRASWNDSLDTATDALMKRPELVRALLAGHPAGPGALAKLVPTPTPEPAPEPVAPAPEPVPAG
ncbi:MAG: hypothetical protein KF773_40400 [Deltaproteobacteria bacterium]|nr:hypothetical protein [Deltaproteobacteria bacterium]